VRKSSKIALIVVLAAVLLPLAGAAQGKPFEAEAFVLSPPATAAPSGNWSYTAPHGYMWIPEAVPGIMEAEWAPWDPWWAMPYGRWAWADGCGWGWTPMIPSWDMSPLGWGYDSWYGGWYGFTPDGNPAGIGLGTPAYNDRLVAQAWMNRHDPKGGALPTRVKVVAVVAKPPVTLNPIRPMLDPKDRFDPSQGPKGYEARPGRQHSRNRGDRTEPASAGGNHGNGKGGGGQVSKPPTGMGQGGGFSSAPRTGGASGKPRR